MLSSKLKYFNGFLLFKENICVQLTWKNCQESVFQDIKDFQAHTSYNSENPLSFRITVF